MSKRIPLSEPFFFGKEKDYVRDAIESTWISGSGKYLEKFESSIGEITDSPYVVACMNGTSALHLALTAAGVKSGDEVLAPTLTFISSINSILYSKASPVFFDSDEFFNIDQNKVINFLENNCEQKNGETFNKRTGKRVAAIIVVHVWGNACNFEKLIKICKERNILIIEDAAESLGTTYTSGDFKGKHTGTIGDFGCISFNGNKIVTAGVGGAVLTASEHSFKKVDYLSKQAKDDSFNYVHNEMGFNYRLSNINAALGLAQAENLKAILEKKNDIHNLYKKYFKENKKFEIMDTPDYARNNNWLNILKVLNGNKDGILNRLNDNGIEARPIWKLCHEQEYLKHFEVIEITNAIEQVNSCICLPSSVGLNEEDIKFISGVINE